jgi:PLP dependent protein
MRAVRLPRRGAVGIAGQHQHQPARAGDRADAIVEKAPLLGWRGVVAEDDAGAARERRQRRPEGFALPLVGHQPEAGQRVAAAHSASYSGAMSNAEAALADVRARIAHAAALAGRRDAIELVAVSKTYPAEAITPLIDAGQRSFGENRVQEAAAKWPALREAAPGIRLHLVGQLQSNKADEAVALFDAIHSVDRPSLVSALAKAMDKAGRRPECFVQVNIGEEAQKGGVALAELPALLAEVRAADLPLAGLMCVPPADTEAAPYFALLAKLARDQGVAGLSMGMSGDYETAVMLGATCVRVGTALFGARG